MKSVNQQNGFTFIELIIAVVLLAVVVLGASTVNSFTENSRVLARQNELINQKMKAIILLMNNSTACTETLKDKASGDKIKFAYDDTGTHSELIEKIYTNPPGINLIKVADLPANRGDEIVAYLGDETLAIRSQPHTSLPDIMTKVLNVEFERFGGPYHGRKALRQITVDMELSGGGSVIKCHSEGDSSLATLCHAIGGSLREVNGEVQCGDVTVNGDLKVTGNLYSESGNITADSAGNVTEASGSTVTINGPSSMNSMVASGVITASTINASSARASDLSGSDVRSSSTFCLGNVCRDFLPFGMNNCGANSGVKSISKEGVVTCAPFRTCTACPSDNSICDSDPGCTP